MCAICLVPSLFVAAKTNVSHKAVASKLHGVEVEISVVKRKGEQLYDDNDFANNSSDTDSSQPTAAHSSAHNNSAIAGGGKKVHRNILHHSNSTTAKCTTANRNNEKLIRPSSSVESQSNDNCNTQIAAATTTAAPPMAKPPRKKEVELSDHIQFLITEKTPHQTSSANDVVVREPLDEGDVVTEGMYSNESLTETGRARAKRTTTKSAT